MKLTTGMRCSTLFHSCTSRAPKKLVASRPVMKYFLTAPETKRPGSRRAGWLVGVYSVSGASRLLRLGLGFGFRFGLGFGLRFGLLFGRFLEVRGVPAGAFQLEAGRAEQLLKRRFAAGRALGERRLRGLQ